MPFFYDFTRPCTTHATTLLLTTHFRMATVANQLAAQITALYVAPTGTVAGGGLVIGTRAGTIGSGGTSIAAPNGIGKVHPDNPTPGLTIFTDASAITPGATPMVQCSVGFSQTGGQCGWIPLEPDDAPTLKPNGGANGNFEIGTVRLVATSQPVTISGRFSE